MIKDEENSEVLKNKLRLIEEMNRKSRSETKVWLGISSFCGLGYWILVYKFSSNGVSSFIFFLLCGSLIANFSHLMNGVVLESEGDDASKMSFMPKNKMIYLSFICVIIALLIIGICSGFINW